MGLIEDLWSRVNDVQQSVNSAVSYAYSQVQPIVSSVLASVTSSGNFGGSSGFGGGGAGGGGQPVQSGGSGPGTGGSQSSGSINLGGVVIPDSTTVVNQLYTLQQRIDVNVPDLYQKVLGEAINTVKASISGAVSSIWQGITELKDSIIKTVTNAWNDMAKLISELLDRAISVITVGVADIVEQSRQIYFTIRQYIDGLMSNLNQGIEQLTGTITESIKAMQQDLKTMLAAVDVLSTPEKFGTFLTKAILASWQSEVS